MLLQNPSSGLYSTLGSDPDLAELIDMFVDEIPDKSRALQSAYEEADWDRLRRLAHQLKGALGSYGFDILTPNAAALELAVDHEQSADVIKARLDALRDGLGQLRSGAAS